MTTSMLSRIVGICAILVIAPAVFGQDAAGDRQPDKNADANKPLDPKKIKARVKEIAGTAEFLRSVPKHFATLKAVDVPGGRVTLLLEGEVLPKVWPLVPDGEVKISGWWGRLGDLVIGDRVWVWFKTDRKKQAVAISMIADEPSEQDIHGNGVLLAPGKMGPFKVDTVFVPAGTTLHIGVLPEKGSKQPPRWLLLGNHPLPDVKSRSYVQSAGKNARLILSAKEFQARREEQKERMRKRWLAEGLPGTAAFVHTFSGEMDLLLDHETMRWARSLHKGDKVTLRADPPIKAVVKDVQPWRERTRLRLVVNSFDLADLSAGQRLQLLREAPSLEVDTAQLPPDIDRPRSQAERVEWFLSSIYCTCGIRGDRCTGHFYTLASCNPNGCAMPNHMRQVIRDYLAQNMNDRQIFQALLKEFGPDLLRPHLLP